MIYNQIVTWTAFAILAMFLILNFGLQYPLLVVVVCDKFAVYSNGFCHHGLSIHITSCELLLSFMGFNLKGRMALPNLMHFQKNFGKLRCIFFRIDMVENMRGGMMAR